MNAEPGGPAQEVRRIYTSKLNFSPCTEQIWTQSEQYSLS